MWVLHSSHRVTFIGWCSLFPFSKGSNYLIKRSPYSQGAWHIDFLAATPARVTEHLYRTEMWFLLLQMDKWTFSRACELQDLQISPLCQDSDDQIGSPHAEIVSWPNYTQDVVSSLLFCSLLPFPQSGALWYQRAKALSEDTPASLGSVTVVAEMIISIATLYSAQGYTYKWACALFEISLVLFFVFLLKRLCGRLFSVLDYSSILQGLLGYDIKFTRSPSKNAVCRRDLGPSVTKTNAACWMLETISWLALLTSKKKSAKV